MKCKLRKSINKYHLIILDMDGTLYFQFPVRCFMLFELFYYYAIHLNRIKDLLKIMKYRSYNEKGIISKSNEMIDHWMLERPLKYIYRFRDKKLLALVNLLQKNGAKIAVFSDYPAKDKAVALKEFEPDHVFSAGDIGIQSLKPDARGLSFIIRTMDIPVSECLYIGDRYEKDGKCAEAAGMDYMVLSGNVGIRYKQLQKIKKEALFR